MPDKNAPTSSGSGAAIAPADVARIWGVMSHEIRTPLMGVVGMLEVLNRTSLTDEQRRILATVSDSSSALMHIIDDVLDFAKLESTQVKLDDTAADPAAIVEGTAELLAALAGAKRLNLFCEAVGVIPLVRCDALRLRQVLLNIGTNAVKYTDSGHVTLSVSVLSADARAVRLRFSVTDTGQGVPLELQGYLFEPFWQLAGREAQAGAMGGVGLGLAICRTLVEAMGGTIAVDSQPGKGSRFDVDIAFDRASAEAPGLPRFEDTEIVAVDTGERSLAIALGYLSNAGVPITRVDSLGSLGRLTGSPNKKTVVLLGGDTEAEDVEATAAALQRMGTDRLSSIVWLHRGAAGSLPTRSGVWPVRANPLRRADLYAAVARVRGAREGDGFAVIARHQEKPVDPTASAHEARADGLVILVAEDNKVNQEVLRQQLAILGYDCDIAPTGDAALKAMGERRYPLLLCDCHMPGMDGFELTRHIRAKERDGAPRTPIVAVTANAVPGEAARCRAAGMDDYLAKPIEIGSLQEKLTRWIGVKASPIWSGVTQPAPVSDVSDKILDLRSLSAVYGHDPARLAPILLQWSGVMTEVLKDLEESVAAHAWDAALAATHRIKGSAGVAGAARVSAAAADLEVVLRAGDRAAIARECARVKALAQLGMEEAAAWRGTANTQAANDQAALSDAAAVSGARM